MKFAAKACLALAGCALTAAGMAAAPAYANDWDYAIDSPDDGYELTAPLVKRAYSSSTAWRSNPRLIRFSSL
jgi:hypothetical protein